MTQHKKKKAFEVYCSHIEDLDKGQWQVAGWILI